MRLRVLCLASLARLAPSHDVTDGVNNLLDERRTFS